MFKNVLGKLLGSANDRIIKNYDFFFPIITFLRMIVSRCTVTEIVNRSQHIIFGVGAHGQVGLLRPSLKQMIVMLRRLLIIVIGIR